MDKLYETVKFYKDNLLNRRYHLRAAKKGTIIEFDIKFGIENFYHLAGLNKLTDIRETQANSRLVFNKILHGKITISDIMRSEHCFEIDPRLNNFKAIKEALYSEELMIKSLHGSFNSIRADFMLTNRSDEYGYAHLFLKEKENAITIPVTFIINPDNSYLRNNPNKWTVISIEEI